MWRALLLTCLGACATPRPAPKPEHVALAGARATFRPFADDRVCEAEPPFVLEELLSINEVLKRYLRETHAEGSAAWTEAQLALAQAGARALPPLLDQHTLLLQVVSRCPYARSGGFPMVLERGRRFLSDARAHLDDLPARLARVKAQRALAAFHAQRLEAQEDARRNCPTRLGAVIVSFAWSDEQGVTRWLFCDGAEVTLAGDEEFGFEPPPSELLSGRRPKQKLYLKAVDRYPSSAVMRAPLAR